MATSIARLAVHFAADVSGLKAGVAQVNQAISKVGAEGAGSAAGGLSSIVSAVGLSAGPFASAAAGLALIAAPLAAIASVGIPAAAAIERLSVKLEVLTGSAQRAGELLSSLRAYAINSPVSFADASSAASTLLAMGQSAQFVAYEVEMLGEIALGTNQPLNELAQVFGQVMQAGRLTGNELRQFNERGIPLLTTLSQMMGVSKEAIRQMVEEGVLGADKVVLAFQKMTEAGGTFAGMSEKINQTVSGQWEKLGENITRTASSVFEGPMSQGLVIWLEEFNYYIEVVNDGIIDLRDTVNLVADALEGLPLGTSIEATMNKGTREDQEKYNQAVKETHKTLLQLEAVKKAQEAMDKKAAEEADKAMKKMKDSADSISKSLRTPSEVFADTLRELQTLMGEGLLSWEIYSRGVEKAQKAFQGSSLGNFKAPTAGTAAVERGTTAAFSAIQQSKRDQDAAINQQREMLAVEKQQRKILEDILAETRNKKPVTVAKVEL